MAKTGKRVKGGPSGEISMYCIVGAPPNHEVQMPMELEEYKELKKAEGEGELENHPRFKDRVKNPRASLLLNKRMYNAIKKQYTEKTRPGTNEFWTTNEEMARRAWRSIERLNPNCYVHPMATPIPGMEDLPTAPGRHVGNQRARQNEEHQQRKQREEVAI